MFQVVFGVFNRLAQYSSCNSIHLHNNSNYQLSFVNCFGMFEATDRILFDISLFKSVIKCWHIECVNNNRNVDLFADTRFVIDHFGILTYE